MSETYNQKSIQKRAAGYPGYWSHLYIRWISSCSQMPIYDHFDVIALVSNILLLFKGLAYSRFCAGKKHSRKRWWTVRAKESQSGLDEFSSLSIWKVKKLSMWRADLLIGLFLNRIALILMHISCRQHKESKKIKSNLQDKITASVS